MPCVTDGAVAHRVKRAGRGAEHRGGCTTYPVPHPVQSQCMCARGGGNRCEVCLRPVAWLKLAPVLISVRYTCDSRASGHAFAGTGRWGFGVLGPCQYISAWGAQGLPPRRPCSCGLRLPFSARSFTHTGAVRAGRRGASNHAIGCSRVERKTRSQGRFAFIALCAGRSCPDGPALVPCCPICCRAKGRCCRSRCGSVLSVLHHEVGIFWGFSFASRGAAIVACCAAAARRTQTWPLALAGIWRGVRLAVTMANS